MKWIKEVIHKYEEIFRYLVIGVLTTLVSLATKYVLLFTFLDAKNPIELQISVVLSWILSVLFAYVTNRSFVFQSKSKKIFHEISLFVSSRVVTLLMESFLLWLFITHLKQDGNIQVIFWTLVAQVVVIVGNYLLSKFIVFSKKR